MKYSVITPIYNSFNCMGKYFEFFEKQKDKSFELILIDDCSTDDSYEQIKKYSENSELNIVILKSEKNSGPGNARNLGIKKSSGKWITFVDSDDWVEDDFFSSLDSILSDSTIDCLIFDYCVNKDNNEYPMKSLYYGKSGEVSVSHCIKTVRNHTFGKVYLAENLKNNNILFPLLRRQEDVAFVCRAVEKSNKVFYLDKVLYHYYCRRTSLSKSIDYDESDMIKAFSILEENLADNYSEELKEKSVMDLLYGTVLIMCKCKKSNSEIRNYISLYSKKYTDWWKCEILFHIGKSKLFFIYSAKYNLVFILKILTKIHTILFG